MRPPPAHDAALPAGWYGRARIARPGLRLAARLGLRARLALLATCVLAAAVPVAAYLTLKSASPATAPPAAMDTARLGTATCATWRDAGVAKRLATIRALGLAATQPDPENAGATLGEDDAYLLFQRVCSPRAAGSTLLYEAYNRAASFRSLRP